MVESSYEGSTFIYSNTYSWLKHLTLLRGICTSILRGMEDSTIDETDELCEYTPLPRPETGTSAALNLNYSDNSDQESEQDDPSSDDSCDSPFAPKKMKIRTKVKENKKQQVNNHAYKNKYAIWCEDAQENALVDNLENCGVKKRRFDRNLGVESYNFVYENSDRVSDSVKEELKKENPWNNKRKFGNRNTFKQRQKQREEELVEIKPRILADLRVTEESTDEEVATDIANKLFEPKDDLILKAVQTLGKSLAISLFNKTKSIEGAGGMMVMNQSRRRTPGGVYFFLIKNGKYPGVKDIFGEDERRQLQNIKKQKAIKRRNHMLKLRQKLAEAQELPDLPNKAEIMMQEAEESSVKTELVDKLAKMESDGEHVSNPPPSPATDGSVKMESDDKLLRTESDGEQVVSNPPPSPATDGRENSDEGEIENNIPVTVDPRKLTSYNEEDDFLSLDNDEMDLF